MQRQSISSPFEALSTAKRAFSYSGCRPQTCTSLKTSQQRKHLLACRATSTELHGRTARPPVSVKLFLSTCCISPAISSFQTDHAANFTLRDLSGSYNAICCMNSHDVPNACAHLLCFRAFPHQTAVLPAAAAALPGACPGATEYMQVQAPQLMMPIITTHQPHPLWTMSRRIPVQASTSKVW